MQRRTLETWLVLLLLLPGLAPVASARTIYVDNRVGRDGNDGAAATNEGLKTGPVKTLDRAVSLLGTGDRLEIINNGPEFPYYGSLRLVGEDSSGIAVFPLEINGNGAILDGAEPVPEAAWESLGDDLWRLETRKKGWHRLYRGTRPVPEAPGKRAGRPAPPPGHWTTWRGAIYYRGRPEEIPANEPLRVAAREAGIFLYHVHHVVIRDLTVRCYRLDGVNAHDQSGPVLLEGIRSIGNARSGIFIGGTSELLIRGSEVRENRAASILVEELGKFDMTETQLGTPPQLPE